MDCVSSHLSFFILKNTNSLCTSILSLIQELFKLREILYLLFVHRLLLCFDKMWIDLIFYLLGIFQWHCRSTL